MTAFTSALLLALTLTPAQKDPYADRPRSIYAPSLPQLTRDEEKSLDELLDRFMLADIGKLTGDAAVKATREFQALGVEAVPALLRGLNRAVQYEHSCPAVQLTTKLRTLLNRSSDAQLLDFARDNLGAGVPDNNRYLPLLRQMRVTLALRMNELARANPTTGKVPPTKPVPTPMPPSLGGRDPKTLTARDLAGLARTDEGEPLKAILRELDTRRGPEVFAGLGAAAARPSSDARLLARDLLTRQMSKLDLKGLGALLEHAEVEVRRLAVEVVLEKHPAALDRLLDRVADRDDGIRQVARAALARKASPLDFGPEPGASEADAKKARDRWRTWWDLNKP